MKLQILIPHYKETAAEIKPLLDSIAVQQGIDFNEVGVIIQHDGQLEDYLSKDTARLYKSQQWDIFAFDGSDDEFPPYPFEIKQYYQNHKGVSATRNAALDHATADYVMFCDADDMFCDVCAIHIIFKQMEVEEFDTMVSNFREETRHPETKEILYINREMDSTFVHGKVHRRQYLIDKHIRWNPNLTIHEDSYFNILAQNLTENAKYYPMPFYLWKWRDASVCRHDPKYILKTYNNMLDSNDALIDEFIKRGQEDKAVFYTCFMIFDAYYTMNKQEWIDNTNKEYRDAVEKRFHDYYKKRKTLWEKPTNEEKMAISNGVRTRSVQEGMLMEAITIDDWLIHIENLE